MHQRSLYVEIVKEQAAHRTLLVARVGKQEEDSRRRGLLQILRLVICSYKQTTLARSSTDFSRGKINMSDMKTRMLSTDNDM